MKLYYTPGACSLAVHIAAREAGAPIALEKVDLATRKTETGADFSAINPKGYVPAVALPDGEVLTEAAALLLFVADGQPEAGLVPAPGTIERHRLHEWLTFITSEIHKGFGPLWNPTTPDAVRQATKDKLAQRFAYLDKVLASRPYLTGERFTVADGYLFTTVNWSNYHAVDLAPYPNLRAFLDRVAARPKVQEALAAEGLLKQAA
ncbi:glutathione transferase GstA [Microvirga subterranea]|uniref:Glutathione S-transferase n=1 Tax=Microvirga subterranea TaxID=186651 RepID=A0A370HI54_9HYPH|nr:glutathione transferase GstA [Microvirga subterranea]RDI57853.1 glutathione S-transferase [Microvirga subterranea]